MTNNRTKPEAWVVELAHNARNRCPSLRDAAIIIQGAFEDRERKLREALDAVHYFIDASDCELIDAGMTRDEALRRARDLRDEADPEHIARLALKETPDAQ